MNGALTGVRVVELGGELAVPIAAMLLAEQGATVIKLVEPGYQARMTPLQAAIDRGKCVLEVDFTHPAEVGLARQLFRAADVVVQYLAAERLQALELDADRSRAENDALVYLSLPPFAAKDPRSKRSVREASLGAAVGLFTELNMVRQVIGAPPVYTEIPLPSIYGAVHGVNAVVMALYARLRTGRGDVIEVPLTSAAMFAMGCFLLRVPAQPRRYGIPPAPALIHRVVLPAARWVLARLGSRAYQKAIALLAERTIPLMAGYVCADGRRLFIFAVDHRDHPVRLLRELGILDELLSGGMVASDPYQEPVVHNNVLDTANMTRSCLRALRAAVARAISLRSAAEWERRLGEAGVPCAIQRTTEEWLQLEAVVQSGLSITVDDPLLGAVRQFGVSVSLSNAPVAPRPPPGRIINRDDAVVREFMESARHMSPGASSSQAPRRLILDGIRVLDLSTVVAGPACGRTLAEFGADVTRIDAPRPKAGPRIMCWFAIDVAQGKRSLLLDLNTARGQAVLRRLVRNADIVLHNYRPSVAERLGLTDAALSQLKPDIIVAHVSALQGPLPGPWDDRPGYEPVLQAASGMMTRYGGADRSELHGYGSSIDYLAGGIASYGIAMALYARAVRAESSCTVRTSLAQAANLVQAPFMAVALGQPAAAASRCERGEHALTYLYRASDGWLFVASQLEAVHELGRVPGLGPVSVAIGDDRRLIEWLETRIRRRTIEHWLGAFQTIGVTCLRVEGRDQLRRNYLVRTRDSLDLSEFAAQSGVVVRRPHPAGCEVDTVAPMYARFRFAELRLATPASKLGSDGPSVLAEAGYGEEEVGALLATGVVRMKVSDSYLPV